MAIVSVKEREARRAASLAAAADPESHSNAAPVPPAGPETDRLSHRPAPACTSSFPTNGAASPAASESDDADADVDADPSVASVGYCRPPVASRFRKGDGRPRGPTKGSRRPKSLDAIYEEEATTLVPVRIRGKTMRVTQARALVLLELDKAKKGDYRSIRNVLDRFAVALSKQEVASATNADLTATDKATLAALRAEIAAELSCKRAAADGDAL